MKETETQNASVTEPEDRFERIGTTYYKMVSRPNATGELIECRIPWTIEAIRQDYGKDFVAGIPKYDGFCCVPAHVGYQPVVGTYLNKYAAISHSPKDGDFPTIRTLVAHIFGDQYELGMDYLQLLYLRPTQKLPILLLVSEERNTGKSTFLNFLKAIFEGNATFNTNENFRSQFNDDWNGKLIILVDEVLLNKREDSERLKNLSTTYNYKVEAKGRDREEVSFFAKFVLCSNNEHLPVIIDPGETRYWVRKVERLTTDDTNFLAKAKEEIPAFLHFLGERKLSTVEESRMWFAPEFIATDALRKIIRANRNRLEIDMAELLMEIMTVQNVSEISFCINDIAAILEYNRVKADRSQIRRVVQECWKLAPASNSLSYTTYQIGISTSGTNYVEARKVGRFYTVTRQMLETL